MRGITAYGVAGAAVLAGLAGAWAADPPAGEFVATGALATGPRSNHDAVLLADGRVLVVGGHGTTNGAALATAEVYDPSAHAWSAAGTMATGRAGTTSNVLPDGRVLVAGGSYFATMFASTEIWNPATRTFSAGPSMSTPRGGHVGVTLADGRVLVAGGATWTDTPVAAFSAEIYDPASNSWSPTGSMLHRRLNHAAVLLADGRVLVSGGGDGAPSGYKGNTLCEIFDPVTGTFSAAASMATPRGDHRMARLHDGRVLVIGGDQNATGAGIRSAEIYDPVSNSWTSAGTTTCGGTRASLTVLADGRALAAGGLGTSNTPCDLADIFDPASGSFSPLPSMLSVRMGLTATLLPDGSVLLVGGYKNFTTYPYWTSTCERFIPAATGQVATTAYITVHQDGKIVKVGPDGVSSDLASIDHPTGVALDASGNLYVGHPATGTIEKFSPAGAHVGVFATIGSSGPYGPQGLAFDAAGNLYATDPNDNTVKKFTPSGARSVFATSGLSYPTGLAFDTAGNLYVSNGNADSIRRFSPAGADLGVFASTGGASPYGLAFDRTGNLFVANGGGNTIVKITPSGVGTVFANVPAPLAVAFDGTGVLYATSTGTGSVERFSPAGAALGPVVTGLYLPAYIALRSEVVANDVVAPTVHISNPLPQTVVGSASVAVDASVVDAGATSVTSTPAGLSASVAAGGGTVSGTVPLPAEGTNVISVNATDAAGNTGGTSVEVIRDTISPVVGVTSPPAGSVVGTSPVDVTIDVADLTATAIDAGGAAAALPAGGGSVTVSVDLAGGVNDVAITVTDAAGNETTLTHRIVLDLDAPLVSIESPADGARFGAGASPVAVTARVDDLSATTVTSSPAGIATSLPAGGGVVLGALDLVEGTNTLSLTATDATGRTSSASVTVVLDTTAPVASFASPQAGDALRGIVDLHVAAADPLPGSGVASVLVTLDGNALTTLTAAPFETTLDTTSLADGPHLLALTATDGAGNAGTPVPVSITVDNTPPAVHVAAPADGSVVGGTVPFEVTVSDATSGVAEAAMTVGGQAPTTDASRIYATPVASDSLHGAEDTTLRPDGLVSFAVTVRDAAGNVATASVSVELDNSNPASSLVAPHDGDVVRGGITIQAAASDPHLASLTLLVDGVQVATSTTSPLLVPFDTRSRLDGAMTVELRVSDTAGNTGTSSARVTVNNISFELEPSQVRLKSQGRDEGHVQAKLSGTNLALLRPTQSHAIELRIPGGNPVPALAGTHDDDDDDDDRDSDGHRESGRTLKVQFSRSQLIASIRAGIAGGRIDAGSRRVVVALVVDGLVQGTTVLGFTVGN